MAAKAARVLVVVARNDKLKAAEREGRPSHPNRQPGISSPGQEEPSLVLSKAPPKLVHLGRYL